MQKYIFILSLIGIGLFGCVKEPNYADIPEIEFRNIEKFSRTDAFLGKKDSVVVTLFFKDGDGDLGISPATVRADSLLLKSYKQQFREDFYNYLIKTFRRKNGNFSDVSALSGVQQNGRFARLRTDAKAGAIDGFLYYSFDIPVAFSPKNDTLRFDIKIRDRAFNTSNSVQTTPVVINQ